MKYGLILALLFYFSPFVNAGQDLNGSHDSEVLGRIPGSYISTFFQSDYDELNLPLSANSYESPKTFTKKEISGRQELIIYTVPEEVSNSVARIYKSVLDSAKNKKINVLFSCKSWKEECGYFFPKEFTTNSRNQEVKSAYRYGLGNSYNYDSSSAEFGVIVGETKLKGRKTYFLSIIGKSNWDTSIQYSYEIITAGELEAIELSEPGMRLEIEEHGRVVLSGLFFDNATASLKPESAPALEVIARYVLQNPRPYLVVGHTDYNGDFLMNQSLSESRANNVVKALIEHYGIKASQLRALGVGYAAPHTSNQTEEGRAKNRRVELVPESL